MDNEVLRVGLTRIITELEAIHKTLNKILAEQAKSKTKNKSKS